MSAIALLPWIRLEEPLLVEDLRLLPYQRKKLPGDLPLVVQVDIDAIFGAYADRPKKPVQRGALVEIGGWKSGMEASAEVIDDLRRASDFLTFSALSNRQLFRGHFGYVNAAAYKVVIQRFEAGQADRFAYQTRRRDGGTLNFWSSDAFNYARPTQTEPSWRIDPDIPLLECLLRLPKTEHRIFEAVREFNAANSDSPDIPVHVEMVMIKAAFEGLLNINTANDPFTLALARIVPQARDVSADRPLAIEWIRRWTPKDGRLLTAWGREFCALRGVSAHGQKGQSRLIWDEHRHLAYASILFPLVLKRVLAEKGHYTLSEYDESHLGRIENYLEYDPFPRADGERHSEPARDQKPHPWDDLFLKARRAVTSMALRRQIATAIDAVGSSPTLRE